MQETTEVCFIDNSIFNRGSRDRAADPIVLPHASRLGDVAAFGCVDAVHMADAFTVFRILSVGNVDPVLIDNRCANKFVPRLRPNRIFRVRIKLPELFAGQCFITSNPTVALCVDQLNYTADCSYAWRTPLSMENSVEHRIVFPNKF